MCVPVSTQMQVTANRSQKGTSELESPVFVNCPNCASRNRPWVLWRNTMCS